MSMNPAVSELDRVLDEQSWRSWHTRIAVLLLLVFFFNAYCTQVLAVSVPAITQDWGIPAGDLAGSMAAGWLGSAIGALIGGMLGDKYGRRSTTAASSILLGFVTAVSAAATTPGQMVVLRVIAGIGIGAAVPPLMAMLAECIPARRRGLMISLAMNCNPIGIAVCAFAAALLPIEGGWEANFIIGGVGAVATGLFLWLFADESPRFLARRPARRAEFDRVLQRLDIAVGSAAGKQSEATGSSSALSLFSPSLRTITLQICLIFISVYLAIAVLLSWVPAALTVGGYSTAIANSAVSVWSIGGIIGSIIMGLYVGRLGPRRSTQISACASAIPLVLLAIVKVNPDTGSWLVLTAMFLSGATLSALMTAGFAELVEAYAPESRSVGIGVATTAGRVASIVGGFAGIHVIDAFGLQIFFLLIGAVALVPALALIGGRRTTQEAA